MTNVEHSVALVLGGYVNGYSIIRELHACGVKNIWLFDYGSSLARYSNRLIGRDAIEKTSTSLRDRLEALHSRFSYIVIFPTDDLQLEMLSSIYDDVSSFCFLPFNRDNLLSSLDKNMQYAHCARLGIPYPKTTTLATDLDLVKAVELAFPIIIKPCKRDDLTTSVFRNLCVQSPEALVQAKDMLTQHMSAGVTFLASELVPGDDTQIYAYTAYRSRTGTILNEWIGKKLTQYPDRFGVVSSATNDAPEMVRDQGRALVEGMDLVGIVEPEFKLDVRDGSFKLMEINLRSMMWHRVGNLTGVTLQYTQWLDAMKLSIPRQRQDLTSRTHFVYMKHEIINLLSRRGYWRHFKHNVFGGAHRHFAVLDWGDLKPFFYDVLYFARPLIKRWLRVFFSH